MDRLRLRQAPQPLGIELDLADRQTYNELCSAAFADWQIVTSQADIQRPSFIMRRAAGAKAIVSYGGGALSRSVSLATTQRLRDYLRMTDSPDTVSGYRGQVMTSILEAVLNLGSVDGADACTVNLPVAVQGMCDAIAMLVASSGENRTPKARRETADLCRRHIFAAANKIASKLESGELLPWTMEPLGERH